MSRRTRFWPVVLVILAAFAIAAGGLYCAGVFRLFGPRVPANALMIIAPYRYQGTWVFDDPSTGLVREPFVSGVPEMIDEMVREIPNAEQGFRLLFSAEPFPGHTYELTWRRGDSNGNWYYCEQIDKEGWLCPAMFKYYRTPPKAIYVRAEEK
mgnify:CR=1 FL=1